MNKKQFRIKQESFLVSLLFILMGIMLHCVNKVENLLQVKGKRILLVVTTDYSSGALSAINLENNETYNNLLTLHQDSTVRELDEIPYILEREGADNIKRLDKNNNFKVIYEESLRKNSDESINPHDIAKINNETALVSAYNLSELRVINLSNGKLTDTSLDVSSYSSDATPPDISQLLRVDDFIYASLHDIVSENCEERTVGCYMGKIIASKNSRLLKIDISDANNLSVAESLQIPFKNLSNRLQLYSSGGELRIVGAGIGSYSSTTDGGVVSYNINTNSFDSSTFKEEATSSMTGTQARNLTQVIYVNDNKAFALLSNNSFKDFIVVFNPATQTIIKELLGGENGGSYSTMLLDEGKLFISDRESTQPGIRIFNVETLEEITINGPINVGLPPASMVVIERDEQ